MGLGDDICDADIQDVILKGMKDSGFLGSVEWMLQMADCEPDSLEESETTLYYNAYSVAFHTLWPMALTMLRSDCHMPNVEENPIMMKLTRLRLREKLLSAMEEVSEDEFKFKREKLTEDEDRKMLKAAWELEEKKKGKKRKGTNLTVSF